MTTEEQSLYRIWADDKVRLSCIDDVPTLDLTDEDLKIIWEWTNRTGPANCWASEAAKIAGWVRMLLIDLEVAKENLRVATTDHIID